MIKNNFVFIIIVDLFLFNAKLLSNSNKRKTIDNDFF